VPVVVLVAVTVPVAVPVPVTVAVEVVVDVEVELPTTVAVPTEVAVPVPVPMPMAVVVAVPVPSGQLTEMVPRYRLLSLPWKSAKSLSNVTRSSWDPADALKSNVYGFSEPCGPGMT
jgi:hypothetical protein